MHPLEEAAQPSEGAAGTDTDHHRVQVMAHLFPNLRTSAALVREWIRRIAELINIESAWDFLGEACRHVLIILRMTAGNIGPRHPHLRAERTDVRDFFLRHLIGDNKEAAIALCARNQRQAEACVPGSRLDNGTARCQASIALRGLNHRKRDAILDRTGWILVLELKKKLAGAGIHPCDFHERGVANER